LKNGSLAAGFANSTIIIWQDEKFTTNTKLNGHEKKVKSLALFGDDLLASGSCDSTIKIWNLTTAVNIKNVTGHEGCVNALVSIDFLNKPYLLSISDDSTIKVWNSSFYSIATYLEAATALAYDPISKYVATGSVDNNINLYSVSAKLSHKNDTAHQKIIRAICILKNGLIATGSSDFTIKIWKKSDSKTLELITTLTEHESTVYALEVLTNGSLISGSGDKTLRVWNQINETYFECAANLTHPVQVTTLAVLNNLILGGLANGLIYVWNEISLQINQVLNNHTRIVWSIVLLDNESFASASDDGTIKIWKINSALSFLLIKDLNNMSPLYSLAVLKNGQLVSAGIDPQISIWQKDTFVLIKVLKEHVTTVLGLAVFKNNSFISVSADETIVIWDSDSLTKKESFNTKERLRSVAIFSKDSFITGTEKGSLSVWDTESIDLLFYQSFQEKHSDSILALTFMRLENNDLLLLSSSNDKTIKVWDMQIYQLILLTTLTGHTLGVTSVIPIDQKSFASGSADKSVKIWEYYSDVFKSNFKSIETITESLESILALAVKNETKLISSSIERHIKVFDKSIEIKNMNELKGHSKSVQDIVILTDNSFASCSGDKTIIIWSKSIPIANLTGHTDYVIALEYYSANHILVSGSKDTTIRLWNTSSSFSEIVTMYFHEDSVNSLLILSNQTLISGSCDNKIAVWNLSAFKVNLELEAHKGCVNALVLYNLNKFLVSGSTDTTVIIWDISNNFKLTEILKGHEKSVNSIVIYQENIVSASSDKLIKIWSKYKLSFKKLLAHKQGIGSTCFLNEALIVTGSYDSTIKIWKKNNQTLKLVTTLTDHFGPIYTLKCLSNHRFISSSGDFTVKIWQNSDLNKYQCVKTLNHITQVVSLIILNNLLISGDDERKIYIWNMSSFELLSSFRGHEGAIWSLISLNKKSFASASEDSTIKIWKQETNSSSFKCIQNLTEHTSKVYALAVLKEKYLISGSAEGLINIWHLISFGLIKTLSQHKAKVNGFAVLGEESFISISEDKKIIFWNIETLTETKTLLDSDGVWSVSVIPNNSFLTGNSKGDIKIWSYFNEYKPIKTLIDSNEIFALKVLNNGLLVSASQKGIIRIWVDKFQSKEIIAHSKAVLSLNVFPNGTLISSSEDKTIKTWNTQQYILDKTIQ
jgi:WD40 repeat protein